ncbi:hypothetical protein FIBSPDRAFT_1043265 [Athelia psychrophila]|uniref:Nephrocystin 3-like N-terminal domain-containing protein n=1 Tax=Athelia psychrophila TaxID=1759441 RepID=A0A166LFM0_9AGAM|nr:hypothetical protein FIBSPDRAFT_1043265 [Fibularhizoctonia sp. CBS 109695]
MPPLVAYNLQIISANDLPVRRFKLLSERRNVLVKATIEGRSVQTKVCMCGSSAEWRETFQIEARERSSEISLQLFASTLGTSLKCASEIAISDLLQRCRYEQDAELDLRGTKSGLQGRIKVRLSLSSNGIAIDASMPPAMVAQSIDSVLNQLSNFMRIADEAAKVHPYAKIAWAVLSAAYKIIVAQVAIDRSVADLAKTMQDVYSFVDIIEAIPSKIQPLETIIQRIFIQTAECAIFIQEYSGHGFAGRLLRETMGASTPDRVAEMAQILIALRSQFDTGVAVQIATVSFRIQTDVITLLENQTLTRLGSSGVDLASISRCLPGTCRGVIDELHAWALHPAKGDHSNVLWLYGVSGTGKSTVAATVATHFSEMGRLGAFVGFGRASLEDAQPFTAVKALAQKLAEYDGRLRASIVQVINDRTKAPVLQAPLSEQFDRLIVKTLASIPALPGEGAIVIVLDALYECGQHNDWVSFLEVLVGQTKSLPSNLRFIITSRTVTGIHKAFNKTGLHPRIKTRELRSSSHSDISAYFRFHLHEIRLKTEDLQEDWPGQAAIIELTAQAVGFFAWAVDAKTVIDAHCPPERLKSLLLQRLRPDIPELNTRLDERYTAALNSAGDWTDAHFVSDFRAIMGAIIESPISISTTDITRLVDPPLLRPAMVTIRRLGSLLTHEPVVQVLHPSFLDFLSSRERCGRDMWYFEHGSVRPGVSAGPAVLCLQRMNAGLKRGICNLPFSARLSTDALPEELAYACQTWVDHICTDGTFGSWAMEKLDIFIHAHLLHWFEAMSLMKKSDEIVPMLQRVETWLEENTFEENTFEDQSLENLLTEAIDFARKFADDIKEHPLHVYYTALRLFPSHSPLYRLFHDSLVDPSILLLSPPHGRIDSMAFSTDGLRLVTGHLKLIVWDTATGAELLTIAVPAGFPNSVAFSYDGSRITCGTNKSTVYIWDSVSGAQLIGPLSHSERSKFVNAVAWSVDGKHLLSGGHTGEVILWNITSPQGDRPITTIHHPDCGVVKPLRSVAFSSNGCQIASCSNQGDVYVWDSKTGGIVWSVQEPQGSDPWVSVSFLSSDTGAFLLTKTRERTQARDASTGDLCPLPDRLACGDYMVHLLIGSIVKHHPVTYMASDYVWAAQGEYFAFSNSGKNSQCHVVHLPTVSF